jgi:hypothetical protein
MLSFPFWSRRSLPGKSDKITAGTLGEAADRDECEVLIEEQMQYQRLRDYIRVTSVPRQKESRDDSQTSPSWSSRLSVRRDLGARLG